MARRTIEGARVIVTGASTGIGRALATELASNGATLLITARRQALLDELAAELRDHGSTVEVVAGDLTEATVREAILQRALERFGGVDILINNAGVGALGRFINADESRLRRVMEVNFFAPAELIRIALPKLRNGTNPMVVNVGSILGQRALPRVSEYCASKFALTGLSESLRGECVQMGIDVLLVSPGTTQSEFHGQMLEKQGETPWGQTEGVPADVVAQRIVRAIRKGRRHIIPDLRGWVYVLANRTVPGLLDRFLARYG